MAVREVTFTRDDDLGSGVSFAQVRERFGELAQRVPPVDDLVTVSVSRELSRHHEMLSVELRHEVRSASALTLQRIDQRHEYRLERDPSSWTRGASVPTWNYAIVETKKVSPGPVRVGTTYRQTRSAPSRSEEAFEVTVFEPTSRLEIQGGWGRSRPG
jgi:hypothetical protein